jgi:hypothetical protein
VTDTGLILLGGLHSLAFAGFHAAFWKLFDWKSDLRGNSVANRAILQILNLRLIYVFCGIAALCFLFPVELAETALGRALLAGMALFWIGRTIEQWIFLPYNRLPVHALTALFLLGAGLFAAPLFN